MAFNVAISFPRPVFLTFKADVDLPSDIVSPLFFLSNFSFQSLSRVYLTYKRE